MSLIVIAGLVVAAVIGAFNLTQGVLINEAFALVIIANGLRLLRGGKGSKQKATVTAPAKASVEHSATLPKDPFELPVVESLSVNGGGCGDDCGCGTKAETVEPAAPKVVPLEQPASSGGGCGDGCGCGPSGKAAEQVELGRRTSD